MIYKQITAATVFALAANFALAQAPAAPGAPAVPAAPAVAAAPEPEAKGSVAKLDWLAGCWSATTVRDGSTIHEAWLAPQAGTMMGVGQTFAGNRTSAWEAMRIFDVGESLRIWLRPGARNELTMNLVESGPKFAGFALTEGATTTSLRYERTSDTTLLATFRLTVGENKRGADFSFTRTDCAQLFATGAAAPAPAAAPVPAAPAKK